MFRVPVTTGTSGSGGSKDSGDCSVAHFRVLWGRGNPTGKE